MACNGTYCNAYGTGTTTCVSNRAACATNRPLSLSGEFTAGRVLASDIENLRANIQAEIATYDLHANYGPYNLLENASFAAGNRVYASQYNNLQTMVNYVSGAAYTAMTAGSSTIAGTYWQDLRNRYDTLRQDCICNADCSCNAVCACHNDCGCNYSDERLKENIKFIEVKNGLNIYSWNYLWDKTTRHVGVMAQEILKSTYSDAVKIDKDGYYMVNYNQLPI